MRKRCHRRVIVPMPPRGLRPKLAGDQVRDLSICHHINLDAIARGTADEQTLWDWVESIFAWTFVAQQLAEGEAEMAQQQQLATEVICRYGQVGRIVFRGQEYQLAKLGVLVMDKLVEKVDLPTAVQATAEARRRLDQLSAKCAARVAA